MPTGRLLDTEVKHKYGRLTVVNTFYKIQSNGWNRKMAECICECGKSTFAYWGHLKNGHTKSCGCLKNIAVDKYKHGESNTRTTKEYRVWLHIKGRCHTPSDAAYKDYGARGITVCDRWINSYENFLSDMGRAPTKKHSMDRRNNELGYSPENCWWTDMTHQANNTRRTIMITHNNETKPLSFWCSELGLKGGTVYARLKRGWSAERALRSDMNREVQLLHKRIDELK